MVKKLIDEIKSKLTGNKNKPPVQIPVNDEEYEIIGNYPEEKLIEEEKEEKPKIEIPEEKVEKKEETIEKEEPIIEIPKEPEIPKLIVARISSPDDFISLRDIIEHETVIINLEDIPHEAINKEISDFKKYLETMDYKVGLINDLVLLAVKNNIEIDKYPIK